MPKQKIEAHKVTKPIQLLAAWLVGLILVNGSLLTAAATIKTPAWAPNLLVIATVLNVPLFLICIFVLQTKFRPEMQEDTYYSKYLEATTATFVSQRVDDSAITNLKDSIAKANKNTINLIQDLGENLKSLTENLSSISGDNLLQADVRDKLAVIEAKLAIFERNITETKQQIGWQSVRVMINDLLPEYDQILANINELGINISDTFGSSSEGPEVPKKKMIGFGKEIDIRHLRVIVNLLKPFGFNLIHYTDDPSNRGDIYIGSYIYQSPNLDNSHKIDPQIENVINDPNSTIENIINLFQTKQ